MNKHSFHPQSFLVLLLALVFVACNAAPSPTPIIPLPTDPPAAPTSTSKPTQSPPPVDGSYQAVITAEDYENTYISESDLCENIGTFTLTVSGDRWYLHQDPALGCTVQWHSISGTWNIREDYMTFQDDLDNTPFLYYWSFNGSELRFTKFMDDSALRFIWFGSQPWVKQAQTAEIPARYQALGLWEEATLSMIGETAEWTNSLELADINGDSLVDILFANGGDFDTAGTPEMSRVFLNQGAGNMFKEVTESIFGATKMLARVIKARDVNDDGLVDIMVGTDFQSQSRLYLGEGAGTFSDVTATHLPQIIASVSDLEYGDVDGDGDLDLVLTDRGPGNPSYPGGRTMLWLNDGSGHFSDATAARMPETLVMYPWGIEFIDLENDTDLDIVIACSTCRSSLLLENNGAGNFSDVVTSGKTRLSHPYEYEVMDFNGDSYLDLVSVVENFEKGRLFLNNQKGGFEEATDTIWTAYLSNFWGYYNDGVILDYDSDGDADVFESGRRPDHLLVNDGTGNFTKYFNVFIGEITMRMEPGIGVADLNNDHKIDVVVAQAEIEKPLERIYMGKNVPPDTAPPVITLFKQAGAVVVGNTILIRARVHDNKSPTMPHDWQAVTLKWAAGGKTTEVPMQWYGEYLWRAAIEGAPAGELSYQVCATDAAGNSACSEPVGVTLE